jgi:RNA polymerase sigma-54 factor
MHLLHLSGYALDEYLQNQLEENPLLEMNAKTSEENQNDTESSDSEVKTDETEIFDEEFFEEEYENEKKYLSTQNSEEDIYHAPVVDADSFTDEIKHQIKYMNLSDEEKKLANYIVDELEDDGYLKRESKDIAFDYSFSTGKLIYENDVEKSVKNIQQCEPAGIAARNLQECLLIQLERKKVKDIPSITAQKIVKDYYDKLISRNFLSILSSMNITNEIFKDALEIIHALNPKPNTNSDKNQLLQDQITPSFEVFYDGNEFSISIINSKYGDLTICQNIDEKVTQGKKNNKNTRSEKKYWLKMSNEAHGLIEAIRQREKTMMAVMKSIVKLQSDFFRTGDKKSLKPMILEHVAILSACDISTVSRITSNKYVQTSHGCFLLKTLFSSSLKAGNENVSSHKVKELIEEIIKAEDKQNPYTDTQIVDKLKDMGISIARRTVVKYRDMLKIPACTMRGELAEASI